MLPLDIFIIISDYLDIDDNIKLYSVLNMKKNLIMYNNLKFIIEKIEKDREYSSLSIFTHPFMKKNRIRKKSLSRLSIECHNIFELSNLVKKYLKKSTVVYKTNYTISLKVFYDSI